MTGRPPKPSDSENLAAGEKVLRAIEPKCARCAHPLSEHYASDPGKGFPCTWFVECACWEFIFPEESLVHGGQGKAAEDVRRDALLCAFAAGCFLAGLLAAAIYAWTR